MKAMLIKDFKLMKNLKQFYCLIVLIAVAFSVFYNNPFFTISYVTILCSSVSLNTISYDNYDNGEAFLFTLPIGRKEYVMEKYVLSMILTVGSLVFASLLTLVTGIIRKVELSSDFPVMVFATFLVAVFIIAYMLPVHLKYRADKSKLVIMLGVGILLLLIYLIFNVLNGWMIDIDMWAENLMENHMILLLMGLFALTAVILAISYQISIRIMEKKEF